MKKTNLKKILSCIMAASMLPAMVTSVSAAPLIKPVDIMSQDFERLDTGYALDTELTDAQLAGLGFTLEEKSFNSTDPNMSQYNIEAEKPKATIKRVTYTENGTEKQTNVLCLEIGKKNNFVLTKNLDLSNIANPRKIGIDYTYYVADEADWVNKDGSHETKRIGFSSMGQLFDKDGKSMVYPDMIRQSGSPSDIRFIDGEKRKTRYYGYQYWNTVSYDIDYESNTAAGQFHLLQRDKGWQDDSLKYTYNITGEQTPNTLVWESNYQDFSTLNDDAKIYLYIDDINVTATDNVINNNLKSTGTTFFNGVDNESASTEPVIYRNNVYRQKTGATYDIEQDGTEIPAAADRLGCRFSGVDHADGTAKLIIARYKKIDDSKQLSDVAVSDATITNGVAVSNTALDLSRGVGETVQAYLWDGFENVTPIVADFEKASIASTNTTKLLSFDFDEEYTMQGDTCTSATGKIIKTETAYSQTNKHSVVSGETAASGQNALKIKAITDKDDRNMVRLTDSDSSVLSTEFDNGYDKGNSYKLSFDVKANNDIKMSAFINSTKSTSVTWNNLFYLFNNVAISANSNDWQHFVFYVDFDGYGWGSKNSAWKYDSLSLYVISEAEQDVYFDNVLLEKVN